MSTQHNTCVTCCLSDDVLQQIARWRDQGLGSRKISSLLRETYDISIGKSALGNHFSNHHGQPQTLLGVVPPPETKATLPKPPRGWEPNATITGDTGTIVSPAQDKPTITDFSDILRFFKIDPEQFVVLNETVQVRQWQSYGGDWLAYYKFDIRKKSSVQDLSDIIEIIEGIQPTQWTATGANDYAFVFAAGDLQLGKSDTDGTKGIVERYTASLAKAVTKYKMMRDLGLAGPILISWVGDCIEGMVSQGGRNARRTELTTTQQVKLLRRLMTETIKAFAPLSNDVTVVSVPGNHDEAQREPVATDHSDSWAVDALVAVSEALTFNPEAFGHVKCMVVPFDELTTTVTVAGTTITHAHGHQWTRGKHWDWWSGQHWGDHDPGKADILLCGHLHTGVYEQQNFKHFIRTPSFEKESTWFRHKTGLVGNPSAVTFLTKDGKIRYMDFE